MLTQEDINELYIHMISQILPDTIDKCIFNMYKIGNFSKEQKIKAIKHNYPNKLDIDIDIDIEKNIMIYS